MPMSSSSPQLRLATLADVPLLLRLGIDTFKGAFAAQNTTSDMAVYLQQTFTEAQVAAEVAHSANQFYLLTDQQGEVAGYCKLNFHQQPEKMPNANLMKISRFYLLQTHVGQRGLAQAMMDFVLDMGRRRHCSGAWLTVWQQNPRAVRFYEKNGFATFGVTHFTLGETVQDDFMMVKLF